MQNLDETVSNVSALPAQSRTDIPQKPYREEEFDEFIKFLESLGSGKMARGAWYQIAEALGIDRKTLERWRHHPLAVEATKAAITANINGMIEAGANDYRMYKDNAKLLGVKYDKQNLDVTSNGETIQGVIVLPELNEEE
jgi:hypothetical protein